MKDFLKFTLASIIGVIVVGFLGLILLMGIFSAIISASDQPTSIEDNSIFVLRFENQIVERSADSPLSGINLFGVATTGQTGLDDILECIEKAKNDDNIRGIYLNPTTINAGWATLEEIRDALSDFKNSGKFIYAYGEILTQKAYYIVSVADKVVLNPRGTIELRGLSAQSTFFKGALDKIGVEVQVIRHGKFKAAVEPYILDKMSDENRLQTEIYVGSIWNQVLAGISTSRGITIDDLNKMADEVTTFQKSEYLQANGLVDELLYKDEVIDELREMTDMDAQSDLRLTDISEYKNVPKTTDGKGLARDKIAVIYASGEIDMGSGSPNGINSDELSRTLREAREDSTIKAIVLRINSPGGSAYGSEVIWREVQLAAETKPVIASMGDYAASGGYYIAAAADTIMADLTTITGSIGIFGLVPNAKELLNDKLGITQDVVNTNAHSDILSFTRKLTPFELDLMQNYIEDGYDTFISRVADGRHMDKQQVDDIGQGRVWDSQSAQDNGLVDLFGGINDAIQLAVEETGLERYRIVKLPEIEDPFQVFLRNISGTVKMKLIKEELGDNYLIYEQLKEISSTRGILARLPFEVNLE